MRKCRIEISGKVQGVAFRYYSKLKADELGLLGTTKNRNDGTVVTFVQGETEKVRLFVEWCQIGSPASKVDNVVITELGEAGTEEYEDFSILR